jgi:TolB-like protein/DNA-binding winged helix-turn-helix (wHTH) protein/Flp pilus assembly protein TadD
LGPNFASAQASIRFEGGFEVDVQAFELRHSGRVLKLERIPMQVLLILIEQSGRVVSREEIAGKIWGKGVFLDTDNSINGAIRKIRQVLKDDPQQPRFVQTIQGRGYRFIASVSQPEAPAPSLDATKNVLSMPLAVSWPEEGTISEKPRVSSASRRIWIQRMSALTLCCVIALASWAIWNHFYVARTAHAIRSIAVLPLQNLSGDPSQEYFADAMTDELITELSRIQNLKVISHTSVLEYKDTRKHLPQIAHELGVDGVLEGSVVRDNDQVRVTVQLLDGPADRHLWSEDYRRPMHGILDLQREVAEAIAQQVRIKLTPEQENRLAGIHAVDPAAYEAYLRGRYYLSNQFTTGQPLNQARSFFEESIRKAPDFSLAYSGLANTNLYLAFYRQAPKEDSLRSAEDALSKAVELDPANGEAHDVLGMLDWRGLWKLDAAEREFKQATALSPSDSCAHEDYALFLGLMGRRADAMAEIARSSELDPGPNSLMAEQSVYYQLRDYKSLAEAAQRGILANPNEWVEHNNLGVGLEGTGKIREAISEYQKAVELSGGDQDATASLAHAYAVNGDKAQAREILRTLEQKLANGNASLYLIATIYAGLDEKDKAFEFLEKACDDKALEISWHIKADVRIDNLRSDPRFQSLVARFPGAN